MTVIPCTRQIPRSCHVHANSVRVPASGARFVACHAAEHARSSWASQNAAMIAMGAAALLLGAPLDAEAAKSKLPPIDTANPNRCDVSALDKFADTRAAFSQESSGGNMVEAIVDVRECDFSGKDLSGKVMSGVILERADFSGVKFIGSQFARANARSAKLAGADFTDTNLYSTQFDGADLQGANFENSILTGSTFGRNEEGVWANLKGAHFEGALVSSSDIGRICENPTLELSTRKYELGCRATR
ncbi:hypothetical protein PLESTB_000409300 [Pleodorina starrii]|uniref:Uncharacterized protein n=1 Tax=Pleodorina starrii TaxID=330485 RepID=A0A9W6BEE6_9CHLO|nr:hypothetical protein PLESTM_001505700 [Pleodorina starrii]GLC50696.1 hypothetical protein PLESTB_000409300 [Pleodorina starrii]GLC75308.1 hypothetical protein PLESTF_001620600 [Pleodorina starrii]